MVPCVWWVVFEFVLVNYTGPTCIQCQKANQPRCVGKSKEVIEFLSDFQGGNSVRGLCYTVDLLRYRFLFHDELLPSCKYDVVMPSSQLTPWFHFDFLLFINSICSRCMHRFA